MFKSSNNKVLLLLLGFSAALVVVVGGAWLLGVGHDAPSPSVTATPISMPTASTSTASPTPTVITTPTREDQGALRSEAYKRMVFQEVVRAEDRGVREAESKYPTSSNTPGFSYNNISQTVNRNANLTRRLQDKYRNQVLRKYGLSPQEWTAIGVEALENNWPMP